LRQRCEVGFVIRVSPAMIEAQRVVERVARGVCPVLVLGETGTGKELIARELHELSPRAAGPLQIVNCAALPETLIESILFGHARGAFTGADCDRRGVFELARGGTLFLDEVGELTPGAQAALLRVLDGGCVRPIGGTKEVAVDVRVVAATHRDLAAMVAAGRFRLDLFHRLNVLSIQLPPLRERREEIAPLSEHFLARFTAAMGSRVTRIEVGAMALLLSHDWPGNVRELRNAIEHAVTLAEGSSIGPNELPHAIRSIPSPAALPAPSTLPPPSALPNESEPRGLRALLRVHEAQLIHAALEKTGGNQRRAAALLELPLRTLERKIASLSLRAAD
jgi:DNA-binding NtrC family response regulator